MINLAGVQNGTNKMIGNEFGVVASMNNYSKVNVSVYSSEREKFTSEFNAWSRKTAQSTLEMCRVVFEAKKGLASQDFLKFCNAIGRKGEDATVRKYLKIGEKYDKFYQYANLLPNSWTSIYEITQLPSDIFEALVTTENSMANMTGTQIKELMGKGNDDMTKAVSPTSDGHTSNQSSETMSDASHNDEAIISTTLMSDSAKACSDAIEANLCESNADEVHVNLSKTEDSSLSDSDGQFTNKATSKMLEQVKKTPSISVDVQPERTNLIYEVLIHFNTTPTDNTWFDLLKEIDNLICKYNFDVDVIETRPEIV